jgi:ATP-binding cassette subfamily B protein
MHGRLVLYVLMFVVGNIINLAPPLIFGQFIREVQNRGISSATMPYLLLMLGLLFMTELAFWAFHGPARVMERKVAFWSEMNYRKYLLGGVLDLGLTWHGEHDSGDTIDKVNRAGDGLAGFGGNTFQIIQLVVKLVGTTVVLFIFSPFIGMFVFLLVILSFVTIFQLDKYLVPQYRELNEYGNKSMARVFDALSNVTSVKILHIETPVLGGILARLNAPFRLYHANSKLNEFKWFTGAIFYQGIAVVPLGLYIYTGVVAGKTIDAGTVSTLYLYLSNLIYIYFGFTDFYQNLAINKNRVLNAKNIEDAFVAKNTVHRHPVGAWERLTIHKLSFAYEGLADAAQLNGVEFSVRKGERVAVVGESGSGKTTFLKVLHGLYPTAHAQVVFDDEPAHKTSFADLDIKTMLVPQEPEIFSSTILENITLGVDYAHKDVQHAIKIARFESVVTGLPHGLKSVINEKGVNLSGGQKQRLALSRALLFSKDKEIILLDESTSSVDSDNETEIYANIWKAFSGKTVIASIHKMNLLKLFDRIVVFEKGKIVEQGTFDELLGRSESFKKSWDQFVATHHDNSVQ